MRSIFHKEGKPTTDKKSSPAKSRTTQDEHPLTGQRMSSFG
jgi:hypothetical protein